LQRWRRGTENQSSSKGCEDGEEGRRIYPQVRFVRMEERDGVSNPQVRFVRMEKRDGESILKKR